MYVIKFGGVVQISGPFFSLVLGLGMYYSCVIDQAKDVFRVG